MGFICRGASDIGGDGGGVGEKMPTLAYLPRQVYEVGIKARGMKRIRGGGKMRVVRLSSQPAKFA